MATRTGGWVLLTAATGCFCFALGVLVANRRQPKDERRRGNKHKDKALRGQQTSKRKHHQASLATTSQADDDKTHHPHGRRRTTLQNVRPGDDDDDGRSITMQPIGVVRSVYALCVGTPRQGLLAPAARGRIELNASFSADVVDGLSAYSHLWVVFWFHLNTIGHKRPSKIAPPAAGGRRLGVLATRSPHRPNPMGLSLVRLDGVRVEKRPHGKKPQPIVVLDVSGLDVCDGTPVLDLKPHVAVYDTADHVRVPDWVSQGLQTFRVVHWTATASNELAHVVATRPLQFYQSDELHVVRQAMEQVLRMDVRSVYQTSKVRQGDFQAQRSHRIISAITSANHQNENDNTKPHDTAAASCTQQLDRLLIHYQVQPPSNNSTNDKKTYRRAESAGSGAEDVICITSIEYLPS